MKKQDHLPLYCVGPLYVYAIAALTAAFFLRKLPVFSSGQLEGARTLFIILGVLFILSGAALWIYAVPISKIDDGIKENRLVTAGAYALVPQSHLFRRHDRLRRGDPDYRKRMVFPLPFLYWLFLTALMKATEEKWLRDLYGKEYEDYCRRVNRCWPWPKKEA